MYPNIVKDLYIGKSKLEFVQNMNILSSEVPVKDIAKEIRNTVFQMPDFRVVGTFYPKDLLFDIDDKGEHILYITGIPKKADSLDYFRLNETLWSSYYEDNKRGYLFQITPKRAQLSLKSYNLNYGTRLLYQKV